MRDLSPALVCLAILATLSPGPAVGAGSSVYSSLREARPDGRRLTLRAPLDLERDDFRFHFDKGSFHLLSPVEGRTPGMVFLGEARLVVEPRGEIERRSLGLRLGDEELATLERSLGELVLLFGDGTEAEIAAATTAESASPDPAAARALERALDWQRKEWKVNLSLRLLQDLLDEPEASDGVFLALFDAADLPPAFAAVDPRGAEALRVEPLLGAEESILYAGGDVQPGVWYQSGRRPGARFRPRLDALHYEIDTTVESNEEIVGTTTLQLRAEAPVRVVPLDLVSELRVESAEARSAEAADWVAVDFIQEEEDEDAQVGVILPETAGPGDEIWLRLHYRGKEVLFDLGLDVYAVGARSSWYPNTGVFRDSATYELTYRVPDENHVVSVGRPVERREEGDTIVSVWQADRPIRVAGFNYGRFGRMARRDEVSGLLVEVYANSTRINFVGRSVGQEMAEQIAGLPVESGAAAIALSSARQQTGTKNVAEEALVDGLNGARLFHTYFGSIPYQHVAITQQAQFFFGQSWPSLVFLPYQSFMTGTARNVMGLERFGGHDFIEGVGFHEMSHQWWGHHIGWESYHDQWLSEGFADFSAALAIQHTLGWEAYRDHWKEARDRVVERGASSQPLYEAGPIHLGRRLSTPRTRGAYSALVYSKGGFVLHMLRMLLWDAGSPTPDARFIAMMHDFTKTWAGRSPSTEDYRKVVERHMVPAMNATGDGSMRWFFDQWVYGREIPRLGSDLSFAKQKKGEYRITGSVTIEDVSPGFRVLVPLYADFGKGRLAAFGRLPFAGPGTRQVDVVLPFPEKPKHVLANAGWEVLARD